MTYPIVNENPSGMQAVTHDSFIDNLRLRPGAPVPFSGTAITPAAAASQTAAR